MGEKITLGSLRMRPFGVDGDSPGSEFVGTGAPRLTLMEGCSKSEPSSGGSREIRPLRRFTMSCSMVAIR